MEIVCLKTDLVKGIQTVQNIISARSTLPILSHIFMETKDKQLRLVSTDLETGIECFIPANILSPGAITIPARKIGEIVRELPEAEVNLSVKEGMVTIGCQKGIFRIAGLGKDDFPELPQLEEKRGFVLRQGTLKDMLKKTSFAVSHDETRRALTGILFTVKKGKLRLVATDGKRLACIEKKVEIPRDIEEKVIVSLKASNEVNRLLNEGEKEVEIIIKESQIVFRLDNTRLISRLIEGHFPEYQKVIPKKFKERVVLTREPFLLALKRVAVFTSEKSNSVRLDVFKNKILLTTTTPEIGEAEEELDLDYKGEEVSIAFNSAYVLDFLKNEEEQRICLELTDALSPGLMGPAISDKERTCEDKYLYVIMPMKL